MWKRIILFVLIFALLLVALLHLDLVHSDPGLAIEDLPIVLAVMAWLSWHVFRSKLPGWRVAVPILTLLAMAIGCWFWTRAQYDRAVSLRIERVSLAFPGLYFPKDSLRYTYSILAETDRPHEEVEREILRGLRSGGVHVAALRIHFSAEAVTTSPTNEIHQALPAADSRR